MNCYYYVTFFSRGYIQGKVFERKKTTSNFFCGDSSRVMGKLKVFQLDLCLGTNETSRCHVTKQLWTESLLETWMASHL